MLQTNVGKVALNTPLLLASGYITETPEFFLKTSGCSGMVTRSLKKNPPPERKNIPAPRYVVFDDGKSMLNCEWGNSTPWTEWYEHGVADVKNSGGSLILSISGRVIEDCSSLIKKFDEIDIDAFEINVSCSHSGAVHGNLNIDIEHLKELLTKIRPLTGKPIWVKLSYSSYLLDMAKIAEKLNADAIVCSNSIGPGLFIDTETGLPKLGIKGGAGGVTGKAIFPIALNCVYQLAQTVKIPIVGIGGISTADDVVQMMMAGASAVQLYTAPAITGPEVFRDIVNDLTNYLTTQKTTVSKHRSPLYPAKTVSIADYAIRHVHLVLSNSHPTSITINALDATHASEPVRPKHSLRITKGASNHETKSRKKRLVHDYHPLF